MNGGVEAPLCLHFHISSVHSPTTKNGEALRSCAKCEGGPTLFPFLLYPVTAQLVVGKLKIGTKQTRALKSVPVVFCAACGRVAAAKFALSRNAFRKI